MNKQVKIILTIVGIAAVAVPAMLLIFLGGKAAPEPEVSESSRQIDTQTIKDAAGKVPPPQPEFSPAATASAEPSPLNEGSPSAQ